MRLSLHVGAAVALFAGVNSVPTPASLAVRRLLSGRADTCSIGGFFDGIGDQGDDEFPPEWNGGGGGGGGGDGADPVTPPDDPFFLRILPLGASITKGLTSEAYGGNGYRKPLRDALRFTGWPVNMVGTKHDGTMHDNNHEGTSGFLISEVNAAADLSIPFLPNIVLLNAGTNDCERNVDFDTAHERTKSLVEKLLSKIPGTTVILSTLVPHKWPDANARVTTLNQRYRDLVKSMNNEHLLLADMNTGWLTESDLTDKTHPTEEGYRKMAAVWERAIYAALSRNVVTRPATTSHDDVGGNSCLKEFGSGNTRGVVKTQAGSGLDDGPYIHSSSSRGTFNQLAYGSDTEDSHTHRWFAQLVNVYGDYREMAIDESVRQVVGSDGSLRFFDMILNQGNGDFIGGGIIDVKNDCKAKGVHWGDVDGDGLDDFICIGAEGNMYVSINDGGTSPLFTYIGLVFSVPKGYSQANVRLGDIDGDGRIDYCVVGASGDIRCWRNGGIGGNPEYWQEMGPDGQIVFTGKGMGDIAGVRLVDINGDFRADWVYVNDDGSTVIYINQRGMGKNLIPTWVKAQSGHGGMGVAGTRDRIRFARIFGSNRADYVYIYREKTGNSQFDRFKIWENTGVGGTKLKGDGTRFCDMRGLGADDMVWVKSTGEISIYENMHRNGQWDTSPLWNVMGQVLETYRDRKSIHLGDWDGDGKCDILSVNRDNGAVEVWRNDWSSARGYSFTAMGQMSSGVTCTQGWGPGLYDLGVRFAHLDDDKRIDYLCIEPDGRADGWLNTENEGMKSLGQVKRSEGKDRANLRWADVDGDGLDDFLFIEKFNGDTSVNLNAGFMEASGSAIFWNGVGKRYLGPGYGPNLHFPNLGGLGVADMVQVNPQTNEAWTWFNDCSVGGSQDDENPVKDPNLPVPPSSGGGGGSPGNGGGGSAPPPPTVGGVYYDLPHFPTFVSLGDSYAAGIGAGSQAVNKWDAQADYQCFTTVNAYGHSFWTTNLGDKGFDFLACTGDMIENVLTEGSHGRPSQISILKDQIGGSQVGMATLSIGGNDAMFAEVAIRCLFFGMNSCDEYMADAELAVVDMRPKLVSTYRAILDAVDYQYFTLIVTGYASFFNDEDQSAFGAADENCDKQTISVVEEDNVLNKHVPYLTRSIRTELNRAVQAMNKQIQLGVEEVQALYPFKRVKFVDMEPLFDGHRFCDKGDDGKLLDLEDVYFFVPYADDITEAGHELNPRDNDGTKVDLTKRDAAGSECESWSGYFANLWDCAWAQAVAQAGSDDPVDVKVNGKKYPDIAGRSLSFITKNGLYKAMHPKSIVHQRLAKLIMSEWKVWGAAD